MEKEIKDFPNYKVNNKGEVFSTVRKYIKRNGEEFLQNRVKKLTPVPFKSTGYLRVSLSNDKGRKSKTIHRLVAEAFIPNPENKPQVNHIDGNKTNNCVDNLEWVTAKENVKHAVDNGINIPHYGSNNKNSKITEKQVCEIITLMSKGYNNKEIADIYNLNDGYVSLIRHKKRWSTVWANIDIDLERSNKKHEFKDFSRSKIPLEKQIEIIGELENASNKEVAKKYNLDPSVISRVRSRKTWKLAHNAKRLSKS